jgi:hypothetical protein
MTPTKSAAVLAASAVAGLALEASALETEQFAVGWAIEIGAPEAFYDIALTDEQYAHARTLAEIAILDAAGEPMPFFRVENEAPSAVDQRTALGVSAIYRTSRQDAGAELSIDSSELRARIAVGEPNDRPNSEVVAFVVDATSVERTITALDLDWRTPEQPFLLAVTIDHSRDLATWRTVGRGTVATLAVDDARVSHGRVAIAPAAAGFYRITWGRGVAEFALEGVDLLGSVAGEDSLPLTHSLPALDPQESTDDTALYFDAGGAVPTQGVRIAFPVANRWISARIESSASIEGPWQRRVPQQLFYQLAIGDAQFAASVVAISRVEARYWRVVPDSGAAPRDLALELQYPQERLRFSAQGQAPYMLVAGTLLDDVGPDRTLEAVLRQLGDGVAVGAATLQPLQSLGGDAAREAPYRFPWQTALLWATLFVGVAVVVWMAVGVAREVYPRE